VEPPEISELIEELEERVERLRALYDQYFMGIEKIEPLILRKDVDRRLWILRREQIRNTGMRFKLQTTIQRYNTYQQYWQRICREIENGTYRRDIGRAAARFGEVALTALGKRRQKMYEKGLAKQAEREAARRHPSAQPGPQDAEFAPARQGASDAPGPGRLGARSSHPPSRRPDASTPLLPARPSSARPAVAPPAAARAIPPGSLLESLELDMLSDFVDQLVPAGVSAPAPAAAGSPLPAAAGSPLPAAAPRAKPLPCMRGRLGTPSGPGSVAPSARAMRATGRAPAISQPPAAPCPPPHTTPAVARSPVPPARPWPSLRPASVPAPLAPPAPSPPAAARVADSPALDQDDDLAPARLRQIYGQYVDAKRRCNESTASITFEKVAHNLRETARQLRARLNARKVDFEVVLKDGTPVLRPVIKG